MTILHQNMVSEPCLLITNILEDKVLISFWFSPLTPAGKQILTVWLQYIQGEFLPDGEIPFNIYLFVWGVWGVVCMKFVPTFHKRGMANLVGSLLFYVSQAGYELPGKSVFTFCLNEEACTVTSSFLSEIWALNLRCLSCCHDKRLHSLSHFSGRGVWDFLGSLKAGIMCKSLSSHPSSSPSLMQWSELLPWPERQQPSIGSSKAKELLRTQVLLSRKPWNRSFWEWHPFHTSV